MERAVQLGLGEGPIKWAQCSNSAGTIGPRHRHWLVLVHYVRFLLPTLLWAAKGDLIPHIGGAESHQARGSEHVLNI